MRLKTTPQQTPPTSSYSTVAPSVAASASTSTTTATVATQKAPPRVKISTKRRKKLSPARVLLWATFLTPLVLVGSYLLRPAPRIALVPRTEVVSQNGQIFARRIVSADGMSQLAVGHIGEKPLWIDNLASDGVVALSPDGRYLVTGQLHTPRTRVVPEYTFQCRDTVTMATVWRHFGPPSNTTMPVGPSAVTVSSDGTQVAMAVEEGIRIYSLQSGEFERFISTLPKKLDPEVQLSYSPDGQKIIALQSRGVEQWDVNRGK